MFKAFTVRHHGNLVFRILALRGVKLDLLMVTLEVGESYPLNLLYPFYFLHDFGGN